MLPKAKTVEAIRQAIALAEALGRTDVVQRLQTILANFLKPDGETDP